MHQYAGIDNFPATIGLVDDSDTPDASNLDTAPSGLADRTMNLSLHSPRLQFVGPFLTSTSFIPPARCVAVLLEGCGGGGGGGGGAGGGTSTSTAITGGCGGAGAKWGHMTVTVTPGAQYDVAIGSGGAGGAGGAAGSGGTHGNDGTDTVVTVHIGGALVARFPGANGGSADETLRDVSGPSLAVIRAGGKGPRRSGRPGVDPAAVTFPTTAAAAYPIGPPDNGDGGAASASYNFAGEPVASFPGAISETGCAGGTAGTHGTTDTGYAGGGGGGGGGGGCGGPNQSPGANGGNGGNGNASGTGGNGSNAASPTIGAAGAGGGGGGGGAYGSGAGGHGGNGSAGTGGQLQVTYVVEL